MSDPSTGTTRRLVLEPHPKSASAARRWVRQQLDGMGQHELVEAAELATSELVTNAILHAQTPVTVSLDPIPGRCRISVRDQSPAPLSQVGHEPGQVWSSGRGLQILSSIAESWGVDDAPPGKEIWFEPRPLAEAAQASADAALLGPAVAGAGVRQTQLCQAPVRLLRQARQRFADLQREMLLIAFTPDDDEPGTATPRRGSAVPARLVELAQAIEPIPADLFPVARAGLERAGDRVTLSCRFPDASEQASVTSWPDLLDEADAYCRGAHLLTLAAPRREAQARRWFLTEVARQSTGRQPRPWPDYVDTVS